MPHKLRYARQGGFRRVNRGPYKSQFGYGGAGYGGFGRKGQYGGYRSHYPYHDPDGQRAQYPVPEGPPSKMRSSKYTTFIFAVVLLALIGLGIFFSRRMRQRMGQMGGGNPYFGGASPRVIVVR
jgi:hypothetical protein